MACKNFAAVSNPKSHPSVLIRFLHDFSMESCVMSDPKFELKFLGVHVSAQGVVGIVAAVMIVGMVMVFYRI